MTYIQLPALARPGSDLNALDPRRENMILDFYQAPRGFPRYRRNRFDDNYEYETSYEANKVFLRPQLTFTCRRLLALKSAPAAFDAREIYDERFPPTNPRYPEVPPWPC